jgi:hypothetical protein
MPPVLRPLALGELLDQCFRIYRKRFLLFVGISAVPNFLIFLGQALIQVVSLMAVRHRANDGAVLTSALVGGVGAMIAIVLYLIALPLSQAATAIAVSQIHLGHQVTIGGVYRQVIRKTGRYLLILLEMFVIVMAIIAVCALIFAGIRALGSPGLGIFVAVAIFSLAAIYLGLIWALALPCAAIENIGFIRCLSRSYALGTSARLRILLIMFLATVITYALMFSIYMPAVMATVLLVGTNPEGSIAATFAMLISWFVSVCLAGPLAMIALTLAYYDQRVRKEGFDIQLMMSSQMQASAAVAGNPGTAGD